MRIARHLGLAAAAAGLALLAAAAGASTFQPPGYEPRIVINDEAGQSTARALGAGFESVVEVRFYGSSSFTGGFGLCSGALISPTVVLTAQHCQPSASPSQVQVRFTTGSGALQFDRTVTEIARMPGYTSLLDGTDLALLTLGEPVTDRTPFRLTSDFVLGETVSFVGYGRNGLGSIGHEGTRDGQRWAAQNVIDAFDVGAEYSGFNAIYFSDFDNPEGTSNTLQTVFGIPSSATMLPNEGTTAPGDSGGPLLVWRNNQWVIAGVLSGGVVWSDGPEGFETSPQNSAYGDISIWTGLASEEVQAFLRAGGGSFGVIPLPASGVLLLGALGLGLLVGRRRRPAGACARG